MSDGRRETCLWLAELASWRAGIAGRLAARYGDLATAVGRPRPELAAALASRRRPTSRGRRRGGSDGGAAGDGTAWREALARLRPGPSLAAPTGALTVAFIDPLYPAWLRSIVDPPPALFVLGDGDATATERAWRSLLGSPRVAVVGCRAPSSYGLEMATALAADLNAAGVVVVSGLALGIDAAAHRGALQVAGCHVPGSETPPPTVAVMGCGADVCYPRSHRTLRERVRGAGVLVSEFVWGTAARDWRFPARNRVMAGLCHGVVVVEGTARSGALITAARALDYGREVLAVPGEAGRTLTEGPHRLLRDGATLCESGICVTDALRSVRPADPAVLEPWIEILDRRTASCQSAHGGSGGGSHRGTATDPSPRGHGGPQDECAGVASRAATEESRDRASTVRGRVVAELDRGPAAVDGLVERTGLAVGEVLAALGAAEVDGVVVAAPGGVYRVVRGGRARRNRPVGRRTPSHGTDGGGTHTCGGLRPRPAGSDR